MSGCRTERWHVTAYYRSSICGLIDVHFFIDELHELHALIELGPSWQCLDRVEIEYLRLPSDRLTIEQAAEQRS